MRCPNCGNEVPARPVCVRCGASLSGNPPPSMPASAEGPIQIPLTAGQKAHLLLRCLPLIGFTLLVIGYFVLVSMAIIPAPTLPLYLFVGVVILFTGFQAIQSLRDLLSGIALVQEDLLNRSYGSRHGSRRGGYHGQFEQLGRLNIVPKAYFHHSAGQRYRVVYSPVSKIVWALEPPEQRII